MPTATPESITAERKSLFVRFLHRSYVRSAGVGHYIVRRVTPIGWSIIALTIITAVACIGRPLLPQVQIFSIFAAILVLSICAVMLRRGRVRATRRLPRYGAVGVPLRYQISVENLGGKLREAWLLETGPDDRPSFELFTAVREPLERTRNAFDRKFRFYRWRWLRDEREQFSDTASTPLSLKRGEHGEVAISWTPVRRGALELHDLRLALPDPLGLFQKCRKVDCPTQTLLVLPRTVALAQPVLPHEAGIVEGDDGSSGQAGASNDFLSLRDYRPGDPKRAIHWASWAKLGRPVVREYEDTRDPRLGLIFVREMAPGREFAFEGAVTVAASILRRAADSGVGYTLLIQGERTETVHATGTSDLEQQLALAAVEPVESVVSQVNAAALERLSSCLVVSTDFTDQMKVLIDGLSMAGISSRAIVLRNGSKAGIASYGNTAIEWLDERKLQRDLGELGQ